MTKPGVVVTWRGGTTKIHEPDGIESRSLLLAKQRGITQREAVRIIEEADALEADMAKAMGPDHSRTGIFVWHNCYRCDHGAKPCVQGGSHRCDNPRARND